MIHGDLRSTTRKAPLLPKLCDKHYLLPEEDSVVCEELARQLARLVAGSAVSLSLEMSPAGLLGEVLRVGKKLISRDVDDKPSAR